MAAEYSAAVLARATSPLRELPAGRIIIVPVLSPTLTAPRRRDRVLAQFRVPE